MKHGTITYYIEIPVQVDYHIYPAEKANRDYPGCPESIEYETTPPTPEQIKKIILDDADGIEADCWEDAMEGGHEPDNRLLCERRKHETL